MGCCCSALEARVNAKYSEGEITRSEICSPKLKGQTSQGCCQVQGNGALVLTRTTLWFTMLCRCGIDIEIDVKHIRQVRLDSRFLRSYSLARKMLIIDFQDASGLEDSVAFAVRDENGWKEALENAIAASKMTF